MRVVFLASSEILCVKQIYKIRSTEEIFAILEEHRVTLSSMKANRAHLNFAKDINMWEKDLSRVSDTIEIIIQVHYDLNVIKSEI